MEIFDVFNGDADGICALHQLRLASPCASTLITGVKRDIQLLQQVDAKQGDQVTVLDISLDRNRESLLDLLSQDAKVLYFDHHYAGEIPEHPGFTGHIDTSPDVCTSILVDKYISGKYRDWAVVAAFGDNLDKSAQLLAKEAGLGQQQIDIYHQLGILINYNGYGSSLEDLFYHPAELYRRIQPYSDPMQFIDEDEAYTCLTEGYQQDMAQAVALQAEYITDTTALYVLPNDAWARRVGGVFANRLASENPYRAHAILTRKSTDGYVVSVRAPLANKTGADTLCRQYPTGGGRAAAAGINHLDDNQVTDFLTSFRAAYQG